MSWSTPRTWAVGETLTAANMNTFVSNNLAALAPAGLYQYMHHAATRVETLINGGWLECNGTAVSRTTYATLFGVVSTVYGNGDGSTTFNLPDFAGRSPVGLGGTGAHADVTSLGASEGAVLAARRQKHKHAIGDPTHVHGGVGVVTGTAAGGSNTGAPPYGVNQNAGNSAAAATGLTVGPQTGNEPTDTPAYLVGGIWIIKT